MRWERWRAEAPQSPVPRSPSASRRRSSLEQSRPRGCSRSFASTMVIFFQPVLAQERRDLLAIARQPSSQRLVPGHLDRMIDGPQAGEAGVRRPQRASILNLILVNILSTRRDLFSVLRDFVRSNFNAAVDALVAEATTDERACAVEHALRIFVEAGQTSASDVLFAEMTRAPARMRVRTPPRCATAWGLPSRRPYWQT